MELVELGPEDNERYNAFFRAGTLAHPRTLRIAPQDFELAPFLLQPGSGRTTLAAVDEAGSWLGVGSLEPDVGRIKRAHIAWVVRMLVTDGGRGVGRLLLRALIERAQLLPGIEKLNLTVAAANERAVGLYASEGFVVFSKEEDAFRAGGEPISELSMSLRLAATP